MKKHATFKTYTSIFLAVCFSIFAWSSNSLPIVHAANGKNSKEYKDNNIDDDEYQNLDARTYDQLIEAIKQNGNDGFNKRKTVIIQTNDVHGAVENYSYVKGLKDNLKEIDNVDVILVDCGDFLFAKTDDDTHKYVNDSKGRAPLILMNAVGYDYATIGNHEFEFAVEGAERCKDNANFNILSANLFQKKDLMFPENTIYESPSEEDDLKIGFFGMSAPETNSQPKGNIKDISVTQNLEVDKNLSSIAKEQATYLRDNSDIVICISHLGVKSDNSRSTLKYNRSVDMYYDLMNEDGSNPIDLILDGHSHTLMTSGAGYLVEVKMEKTDESGKTVEFTELRPAEVRPEKVEPNTDLEPIISTGIRLPSVGIVVIDNDDKVIEDRFLVDIQELAANNIQDQGVNDLFKEINEMIDDGDKKDNDKDNKVLDAFLEKQHDAYVNGQELPNASELADK